MVRLKFIHVSKRFGCQLNGPNDFSDDPLWRHQMETFSALRALCVGIHRSPVHSPHKGQWCGALIFSLICALNKRLSKQSWGLWFGTPSRPFRRHCSALATYICSNASMCTLICTMCFCYCFIVVFGWKKNLLMLLLVVVKGASGT